MEKSRNQITPTLFFEEYLWKKGYKYVVGIDEAGRGAWAGCVAVGVVMFNQNDSSVKEKLNGVRDSKKLTSNERLHWAKIIKEHAFQWAVGLSNEKEIDYYGINAAVQIASLRALAVLDCIPQFLLIDYFRLPFLKIPQLSIIRGDSKSLTIASASILAKTWRDEYMTQLAKKYPYYGFEKHKGYGTKEHRAALLSYGAANIHRKSYSPLKLLENSDKE